jgi:hypothetical protein
MHQRDHSNVSGDQVAGTWWPRELLPAAAAEIVDSQQFLPLSQLMSWQEDLDRRGLRATGSAAHEAYVSALCERLQAAGVRQLYIEEVNFKRWHTEQWGLTVNTGPDAGPLVAAAYVPYSGQTSQRGVSAPAVYIAAGAVPTAACQGKIAVVDIESVAVAGATMMATAVSIYDPHGEMQRDRSYLRPYIYMAAVHRLIVALEAVGAVGFVAITDAPHSYIPYDRELHSVPGLFVEQSAGAVLRRAACEARSLTITLPAQVAAINTRNLFGIIAGASEELVVINSHTDGTNGI